MKQENKQCKKCGSKTILKFGFKMTKEGKKQRFQCLKCGHIWHGEESEET